MSKLRISYSVSGLKVLSSNEVYVVLDTNVAIRALAGLSPYVEALERLKDLCHIAISSTAILREYQSRVHNAGMNGTTLQIRLESLRQMGKLKGCPKTLLDRAQKRIQKEHLRLPNDQTDVKFLRAGIAKKAKYIISKDRNLLDLSPYRYGKSSIKIVEPEKYPNDNWNIWPSMRSHV